MTDGALRELIVGYTKESGVRQLEREVAALCRKVAMQLAEGEHKRVSVNGDTLTAMMGTVKIFSRRSWSVSHRSVSSTDWRGPAWAASCWRLRPAPWKETERSMPTGNLGDVMKESCQAAVSYIRANAEKLGVASDFYKTKDIHIHLPEGAVPKDGPSAGIAHYDSDCFCTNRCACAP